MIKIQVKLYGKRALREKWSFDFIAENSFTLPTVADCSNCNLSEMAWIEKYNFKGLKSEN